MKQTLQPLSSSPSVVHLQSNHHSVVILIKRVPEIIYWGNKLTFMTAITLQQIALTDSASQQGVESDLTSLLLALDQPVPQGRLDKHIPLSLCPESGAGLFNAPGIEGHRDNKAWAPVFETVEISFEDTTTSQNVLFTLQDTIAELALTIDLRLDKRSDVLQKSIQLKNLGSTAYQLHKLANTLPVAESAQELLSYHGRWIQELLTSRQTLSHHGFIQENRRGKTSQETFPGLMLGTAGFKEETGEVWGFHLGWSGNHQMRAEVKSDGRRFVQACELLFPGEVSLATNETYQTPWLYAAYSNSGLNGMSARFHRYVREQIVVFPTEHPIRPVHLNTWEGIYFDHNPDYIMQMATEAAKMGVERFIIDDGWFLGRKDDKRALGDWYLDEQKYPNGLEPVINHVLSLGMQFGIWVEPEMVNKDSNLYRQHPDWLLEVEGYDQPTGRWQYGLDLQNPACFAYIFERLDALLSSYKVSYLKWDMNRELVQAGHLGQAAIHRQTLALYKLLEQLRTKHPHVEIESCASGGGRIDFEVLKRTQRFWTSDCNDALERQRIQRGMSYFFPPEVMGAHIGPAVCHSTYRQHTINMRGLTALSGHMGVELDPVKVPEAEKQEFVKYIALHKRFRSLIHSGESIRIDAADSAQMIYGVMNEAECLITVCQLTMPTYALQPALKIRQLDPQARYQIECVDLPPACMHAMKKAPDWITQTNNEFVIDSRYRNSHNTDSTESSSQKPAFILSGDVIANIGISMPILDPETAMLIYLKKV